MIIGTPALRYPISAKRGRRTLLECALSRHLSLKALDSILRKMETDLTVFSVLIILVRILIFLVLPVFYLVIKTRKDPRIYEKLEEFPGPKAFPLVGNSLRLVGIGGSVGN
jgi:hypothetical protein